MRRRVLQLAMLLVGIASISTLAVSILVSISDIRQLQQKQVQVEASMVLSIVAERLSAGLPIDAPLRRLSADGSSISVRGPGVAVDYRAPKDDKTFTATASDGKYTVEVRQDGSRINDAVVDALRGAAIVAVLVALVAWLMGRYWVRRLQRVFDNFVSTARGIGSGEARLRGRRYGMRELDEVAEVLDVTAARLDRSLVVERALVDEISHQLRTPLTALMLQLEEVAAVADDPPAVRRSVISAEAQLDRLSNAVSDLIKARRGEIDAGIPLPLVEVLAPVIGEIAPVLQALDREFAVEIPSDLVSRSAPGAVRHIVSILLENAVVHGAGRVSLVAAAAGDWLVVTVADEGVGLSAVAAALLTGPDREPNHSSAQRSIGLPLAKALAAAHGGRLEWREEEPAKLRLRLPSEDGLVDEDELAVGEEAEDGAQADADDVGSDVVSQR